MQSLSKEERKCISPPSWKTIVTEYRERKKFTRVSYTHEEIFSSSNQLYRIRRYGDVRIHSLFRCPIFIYFSYYINRDTTRKEQSIRVNQKKIKNEKSAVIFSSSYNDIYLRWGRVLTRVAITRGNREKNVILLTKKNLSENVLCGA